MIEDHDAGDEDRSELPGQTCPFCGVSLRSFRTFLTAVREPEPDYFDFDAKPLLDFRSLHAECLAHCDGERCKAAAAQFSREHSRSLNEKDFLRWKREQRRLAGLFP